MEIPNLNLDTIIISNKAVHEVCDKQWKQYAASVFNEPDSEYRKFKQSARQEVNYLVKEFECRKAADSYTRSSTSRTGTLDCSNLHSYQYNDDIFKRVTTLAEGKNHGLIFILDWSGSMDKVMLDTCKQLFNLVWFCRKVSIPFEVYAFTSDWCTYQPYKHYDVSHGLLHVHPDFNLMNILSSKTTTSKFDSQLQSIYRIASYFSGDYAVSGYNVPTKMQLSGTPLNEALITLHKIIPMFQSKYNLQKVQCVILTDGDSNTLTYDRVMPAKYECDDDGYNNSIVAGGCILRDRKLGTTYNFPFSGYYQHGYERTDIILRHLRDKFSTVNFIGMRVLFGNSGISSFIKRYTEYPSSEYEKIISNWNKNKSCSIKTSGYTSYFAISGNSLSSDSDWDTGIEDDSPTLITIRNAFKKSLMLKKTNKKILSEFTELIS